MPCQRCQKDESLCVCSDIHPLETRLRVLILQHPQEPDKLLGTARLASLALPQSDLRVGLSWPNLAKALGRPGLPSRWAVLYLGSAGRPQPAGESQPQGLLLVDKKGNPLPSQQSLLSELEGIVVLDGTWSQAKALWWRNPWLLKLRRAILIPRRKSLYGALRREPRRECLSTIESIAQSLTALGEPITVEESLTRLFERLLQRYKERGARRPA